MEASVNNKNSSSDANKQPSEKSVETTSSSTMPSISMHCIHIHDVDEMNGERQHEDKGDVPAGYEIRIVDASSSSSGDGEHRHSKEMEEVKDVMQEKQPNCSLHVQSDDDIGDDEVVSAKDIDAGSTAAVEDSGNQVPSSSGDSAAIRTLPLLSTEAEQEVPPPRHIYALRKIIVEYYDKDAPGELDLNKEEDGERCVDGDDALLSPPQSSTFQPAILSQNNGDGADVTKLFVGHTNQFEGDRVIVGTNASYDAEEDQLFYDAQEDMVVTVTTTDTTTQAMSAVTPPDITPSSPTAATQTPISESPPDAFLPPTNFTLTKTRKTRLIASQMVNISEEENAKLEEISKGTVLCCSRWISDGDKKWRKEGDEELNVVNASDSVPTTPPQPLSFCTNSNNTEDQITFVPYSMAKREMGCNCTKRAEHLDDAINDNCGAKKLRPLKAAYKVCRSIKRTFYFHLKKEHSDKVGKEICKECNLFGTNPTPKKGKRKGRHRHHSPSPFRNVGATMYGDEAVLGNTAEPINDILSIDSSLGIYVCESGLTAVECQEIINAAERLAQSKGAWSAYTYAKQTLGCKEYDELAEASEDPVMTACATVRDQLQEVWAAHGNNDDSSSINQKNPTTPAAAKTEEDDVEEPRKSRLVLDAREPHVVKYDLSRMERQKLDMHTDRSVWTFIIALTEGRGQDYAGGGTFFEKLNATVHLQRGQMLIFRGKLRHRGVKITDGERYLLVGFLVEQKKE